MFDESLGILFPTDEDAMIAIMNGSLLIFIHNTRESSIGLVIAAVKMFNTFVRCFKNEKIRQKFRGICL